MELGDHLGFAGILLGLLGIGIAIIFPTKRWIGYLCFTTAILFGIFWGVMAYRAKPHENRERPSGLVTLTSEQFQALTAQISKQARPPNSTRSGNPDSELNSDLRYTFFGKDKLWYMYSNPTKHAASKPMVYFGLLDLTNPYSYSTSPGEPPTVEPFPVLAKVLSDDYVRPGEQQGNVEVLKDFTGHIRKGDVIWGLAWVTCINCTKRRAYYVYWKVGSGGWYAEENDPKKLELPKPVMVSFSDSQINEYVDRMVPLKERTVMRETFGD